MKVKRIGVNIRKRKINFDLFFSNLGLSIRSRQGFDLLLAWARVIGILLVGFRLWRIGFSASEVGSMIMLGVALVYSFSVFVLSQRLMRQFDKPSYHLTVVIIDTVIASYFIYKADYPNTDLFLFYFLPLAKAAHFFERRRLLLIGPLIIFVYFIVLFSRFADRPATDLLFLWLARSSFLLAGAMILRAKRSLPKTDKSWVASPAEAKKKLEKLLRAVKTTLPYNTASIQLEYRDRLMIVACDGFSNPDEICQIEFPIDDENFPNYLIKKYRKVRVDAPENYKSFADKHYYAEHIKCWMGVPLISPSTGEFLGMISIDSSQPNAYNDLDVRQAGWFGVKVSGFLEEAALGPAALTLARNRENLLSSLKLWGDLLPNKTSKWDDDVQAAKELIAIGQKIFRTEDCSIFFLRHKLNNNREEPVLHLICSTAVPQNYFQEHEMKVTGMKGDGLTGLAVFRNKTLNYGAAKIKKSPYRANFTSHLNFLFSKRSRQVMIAPLRDSKGNAIGAIKIENKRGTSSEKEFFPVEKNLFEIYASMVSLILETIRQKNYINRLDEGIHGLRGIVHHAGVKPISELLEVARDLGSDLDTISKLEEIRHALEYVKMTIHGVLADSTDNIYLEKEGLLHSIYHYLKSLKAIPFFKEVCDRIIIVDNNARDDEMPYQIQEIFFNVAKEGILNIVRHSRIEQKEGGFGKVSFQLKDGIFILTIQDNGVGFKPNNFAEKEKLSFGLGAIRRQMELKKYYSRVAVVEIESNPGFGTTVKAKWAP